MAKQVRIESNRIVLREYVPEDFAAIHQYASDQEAVKFMIWGPNSIEETKMFVTEAIKKRKQSPRMNYELSIDLKSTGQLIGGCGLYVKDSELQLADIGYIIHPDFWKMGFATEATIALVKFGKEDLGIRVVQATCDQQNIGSRRVLGKSGFVLIKSFKDHFKQKEVMRSSFLFQHKS